MPQEWSGSVSPKKMGDGSPPQFMALSMGKNKDKMMRNHDKPSNLGASHFQANPYVLNLTPNSVFALFTHCEEVAEDSSIVNGAKLKLLICFILLRPFAFKDI